MNKENEPNKNLLKQRTITSYSPTTNAKIGEVPALSKNELSTIVENAKSAFEIWNTLDIKQRCDYLKNISEALLDNQDEISNIISVEMGKPISEVQGAELTTSLDIPLINLIMLFS